jgi:hypothetical protein
MKVVFDQSAFHDHLDPLKGSQLLQLTLDGKITVYHTATFLDETLRMADSARPDRKDKLKRQWAFLQSICNGGWFKPLLFQGALDGDAKDRNWPLVPSSFRNDFEAKVTRFLEESGPLPELISARPIYDQLQQVKKKDKAARNAQQRKHRLPKWATFPHYYQANAHEAASLLIHQPRSSGQLQRLVALDQPDAEFEAWRRDPTKFPHFTAFVGLLIYSRYNAEKNRNSRLDPNWQGDVEQLCFLVDVDAVISSDLGFMKRAFEAWWQPSEKRFFTPEEFVAFLSQL